LPFIEAKQKGEAPAKPATAPKRGVGVYVGAVLAVLGAAGIGYGLMIFLASEKPAPGDAGTASGVVNTPVLLAPPQPGAVPAPATPTPPSPVAPPPAPEMTAPPAPASAAVPPPPGPPALASVATLQESLKSPDPEVRLGAALALRNLGPEAREALPALAAALKDEHQQVRIWAALAMTKIAPDDPAVVPGLVEALKDQTPTARHAAALSLGLIGIDQPAARAAAQPLAELAKNDPEEEIRKAAIAALKIIDPELARQTGFQ
jgi:hypothetical protein